MTLPGMRLLSTDASAPTAGPVTEASTRFDPFEPAYVLDPYPLLAQLRESEAVFFWWRASRATSPASRWCPARTTPTPPTPPSAPCVG